MTSPAPLLTRREVAEMLGVHPNSVSRWVDEGKIRAVFLPSGRPRFHRADVEAILAPPADSTPAAAAVGT